MHPLLETLKRSPSTSGGSESRAGRATSSIRAHPPLVPPLHHADASSGNDVAPTLTSLHAPSSPMTSGLPTTSHATRSTHEARKPAQSARNPRPHTVQPCTTRDANTQNTQGYTRRRADSLRADSRDSHANERQRAARSRDHNAARTPPSFTRPQRRAVPPATPAPVRGPSFSAHPPHPGLSCRCIGRAGRAVSIRSHSWPPAGLTSSLLLPQCRTRSRALCPVCHRS
jgi:hypothetical protein